MKNDKFKRICHFLAGAILLPTAFKLFEHKKFTPSVILLLAGIVFLLISTSLELLEKSLGNVVKLAFFLESCVLFFAALIQYKENKKMPAMAFAAAGIVYFLLFLYYLYGKDKKKKHHKRHHHHHHSSLNTNETE